MTDYLEGRRWLAGTMIALLMLVVIWFLFVPAADWLARHDVGAAGGATLATARNAARGSLLTLSAGLVASGALVFTARNFTLSRRIFELSEQGQVTDRYTKAVEQLGSDKLAVRVGGIYALERIAYDSERDHSTVIEVLATFIRERSRRTADSQQGEQAPESGSASADIRAALTAIIRAVPPDRRRTFIDLSGTRLPAAVLDSADLTGLNLRGASLAKADLRDAILNGARLDGADLSGADLTEASLASASLRDANLADASLIGADLKGASAYGAQLARANLTNGKLRRAQLSDADLTGATLNGAELVNANLGGALLDGAFIGSADLTGAWLADAKLPGAILTRSNLAGATLRGAKMKNCVVADVNLKKSDLRRAHLAGAAFNQSELSGADLTGADLAGADLRGATLTGAVLEESRLDGARVAGVNGTLPDLGFLPPGWTADPGTGCLGPD
jgi:uncharacterized protein YjbI with pentapeptide repeats